MSDPFSHHGNADRLPFRRRTGRAHLAQPLYNRLTSEITACDVELSTLIQRRRDLAAQLTDLAERYWPPAEKMLGYKPPHAEELPLPDISPNPEPIAGRRLRSVVMTLLRRNGSCPLLTIHRLLLAHGFVINSPEPVRCLSNALSYEVNRRRARRVARGVYEARADFHPRPGRFGNVVLIPSVPWTAVPNDDLPSPTQWT